MDSRDKLTSKASSLLTTCIVLDNSLSFSVSCFATLENLLNITISYVCCENEGINIHKVFKIVSDT